MSDALNYLIKARPEAMAAYFKFLKGAGPRLDPKTRNLISVITKVHAQTENGLRQYLRRALREGATADEVIDALLMAFPALGLTRIVWAIDVKRSLVERTLTPWTKSSSLAPSFLTVDTVQPPGVPPGRSQLEVFPNCDVPKRQGT